MSYPEGAIRITQNQVVAAQVISRAGHWMVEKGLMDTTWLDPTSMSPIILGQHTKPDEFYLAEVEGEPAAAALFQQLVNEDEWRGIDGGKTSVALYIYWLSVERRFAGQGLPKVLLSHAEELAQQAGLDKLRLDTDARSPKLCDLYESLGFNYLTARQVGNSWTAYFEKPIHGKD